MDLRGWEKFSVVDYPGNISCVLFAGNCNLRCGFCHNPALVFDPASQPRLTEREVLDFLAQRRGLLDGVVLSGGEPLLQPDAAEFVARIRRLGFKVKVDTNGTFPDTVERLLADGVEAFGIDYKAPGGRYSAVCGVPVDVDKIRRSIAAVAARPEVQLDVRTTVHRRYLAPEDLRLMRAELSALGVRKWMLQQYHRVEVIDDELNAAPTYSDRELVELARSLPDTGVRGITGLILN